MSEEDQEFMRELWRFAHEAIRYREHLQRDRTGSPRCWQAHGETIPRLRRVEGLLNEIAAQVQREPCRQCGRMAG